MRVTKTSISIPLDFGLLDEAQVIALLLSGEQSQLLTGVFGADEYSKLRQLTRRAKRLPKNAPRVYILPGLMGSRLGTASRQRKHSLWLDLQATSAGELMQLALPSKPPVHVLGAMLTSYLKLKLLLNAAGFDARLHAYDWRKSAADSAKQFMQRIAKDRSKRVVVIGHSMGGLLARAALSLDKQKRIDKVIQLGTPNYGSFAPVQAFRAVYPSVRKLASLDPHHSPEQLSRHVFRTLPGLYQLLPAPERTGDLNLFSIDQWPDDALGPDATLLSGARKVQRSLAAACERCYHIIGVEQETVVSVAKQRNGFIYHYAHDGDGTVPRALAEWPGAQTWYVAERHGNLPNNEDVCKAIVDILKRGTTRRLQRNWMPSKSPARNVSDAQLRRELRGKVALDRLPIEERRRILDPFISTQFAALAATARKSVR
jgi:pimeloyl-ACP methyl ester carboxylesterase